MDPSTPRYARSTTSSKSRTSVVNTTPTNLPFHTKRAIDGTPTKKSPSSKSFTTRQLTQAQRFPVSLIKPQDATKPCPIATLPPELREIIYTYLMPEDSYEIVLYPRYGCPKFLRICRMIRYEAGGMFYSKTPLTFEVLRLDFRYLQKFVMGLPGYFQRALACNRNLTVVVTQPHYYEYTGGHQVGGFYNSSIPEGNHVSGNLLDILSIDH